MLKYLEVVPSTQLLAKQTPLQNRQGFASWNQTNGVGRQGTKWITENQSSLCFSFRVNEIVNFPLSLIIGVELAKSLSEYGDIKVKWPNDLYINNEKFCGILIDRIFGVESYYIVGIGINVNSKAFANIDIKKEKLEEIIDNFIEKDFTHFDNEFFFKNNLLNDYHIMIDGKKYNFLKLDSNGRLVIKVESGETISLTSNEKISNLLKKKNN